jgi:hypothetical protein
MTRRTMMKMAVKVVRMMAKTEMMYVYFKSG